jgi:hypothetical protein
VKDATLATRTERAVAHLDAILVRLEQVCGRLEYLQGNSGSAPHGEATPPAVIDPEAQKAADSYIERRAAEIEDERSFFEAERDFIE